MTSGQHSITARWLLIVLMAFACRASATSWKEKVLYSFRGANDGAYPAGGVVFDKAGNLYGATTVWGPDNCFPIANECGLVFELSPPAKKGDPWAETLLYSFKSGNDGYFPWGTLPFDAKGNLYGATQFGGGKGNTCNVFYGGNCGTVFELSPPKQKGGAWTEKVLHSFAGISNGQQKGDGANPNGGLVLNDKGAIYGTTYFGGNGNQACGSSGCGMAFALKPPNRKGGTWTEGQIHVFKDGNEGAGPSAGLIFDAKGSLYGVAGGGNISGGGVVFRLTRKSGHWEETVLHWFSNNDWSGPVGALVFDSAGDLYGTTAGGDKGAAAFQLRPPKRKGGTWMVTIFHAFKGLPDGIAPAAALIFDKAGDLYGTTQKGGNGNACQGNCGTVFEVSP